MLLPLLTLITENNPEVMTSLLHKLGLSKTLQFQDVYSISDPDLLAFIPRPSYALLLVFPVNDTYEKFRHEEDKDVKEYAGYGKGEEVLWFKQTIGNACGLYGLLHAVGNGESRSLVESGSELDTLLANAIELEPGKRSSLLEQSDALESAHKAAAVQGDSSVPRAEDPIELHYVCFVKSKEGNLWEMDGRRKGPLLRGKLAEDEDVLSEKGLDLGAKAFLKREEAAGGGDLRFSLISLGTAFD